MDWLRQQPIAHRGLHNEQVPENSLQAFADAVEKQLPIELDVFLSTDGQVFVFHDNELTRLCSESGLVWENSWTRLKQCHLSGSDQRIPLLQDVLSLIDGWVPVMVEIKYQPDYHKLARAVTEVLSHYQGEFVVSSGYFPIVQQMHQWHPDWKYGVVSGNLCNEPYLTPGQRILWQRLLGIKIPVVFIAYDKQYLPYWPVALFRQFKRTPIIAYTVRSQAQADQALKHADNIFYEGFTPLQG